MEESSLNVLLPHGEIREFIGYDPQGKPKVLRSNRKSQNIPNNSTDFTSSSAQNMPSERPIGSQGSYKLFGSLRMLSSQLRDKMGT